jgi:hypothetical protein
VTEPSPLNDARARLDELTARWLAAIDDDDARRPVVIELADAVADYDAAIAAQFIADCQPFIIDDESTDYGHAMSDTPDQPDQPDEPDDEPEPEPEPDEPTPT